MSIVLTPAATPSPPAAGLERRRVTVPWRTVLTLAIVLAYADGFWLTSLRGAVGAIERTQSPFTSWLRESTVLLPVFVVAVLSALTLAMRWLGPVLRGPVRIAAAGLLVVAATTVAAVLETSANAFYDYRLQTGHLQMMDSMRSLCISSCLEQARHATLMVHVHGVLLVGQYLLITNVLLVTWIVVMWGGRLRLVATRPASGSWPGDAVVGRNVGPARMLRMWLVAALIGSAAIHAAVVNEHLSEWPLAGMFFVILAVWELAVAGMLLARLEERLVLVTTMAVSAGPLALWLVSRTVGLPFGPEAGTPEPIGAPDLAAGALELGALAVAILLASARVRATRKDPPSAHGAALGLVAVVAVTALGVAATGPTWFDAFGISASNGVTHDAHQHG